MERHKLKFRWLPGSYADRAPGARHACRRLGQKGGFTFDHPHRG